MEKELKTGKKIVVRELTGLDEILSYRLVGPALEDEKNMIGAAILQRSVLAALSLESVDGEKLEQITKLDDVFKLLARFTKKEWNQVAEAYLEVNEDADPKE